MPDLDPCLHPQWPVVLVWAKRLWRRPDPECPVATWSEQVDDTAPRAALTERARAEICRLVGEAGHSVAQVARRFGVGWHAAMAAVRDHGRPRVDHLSRLGAPWALGVDEHSFLAASAEHPTPLVTGFVDLDRHRLDVVQGERTWRSQTSSALTCFAPAFIERTCTTRTCLGAHLLHADLRASLLGAYLSRARLYGANLTGADLTGANLSEVDLSHTIVTSVKKDERTVWPTATS